MFVAPRRRRAISVRNLVSRLRHPSFQLEAIERRVLLTGSISGTVFSDYNSNGTQDGTEPGLAGWTVYLDSNDNNVPDAAEQKRTTDASGFYEFAGLFAPATYNVREILQPGYQQTLPGSGGVILGGPGAGDGGADGAGGGGGDNVDRSFTNTEIVIAFQGTRGKTVLGQKLAADRTLRPLVDLTRSSDMFTVRSQNISLVEVKLPAGVDPLLVVQRFASLPGVAWAQPNYIYEGDPRELVPNDPQYASQYHHPKMQNNLAWDTTMGRETVTLAITDDGFDTEHVDLYQNIWINQNEIPASRRANLTDLNGDGYISMGELQDPTNRGPFKANDANADNRITAADLLVAMVKDGTGADTGAGGWSDGIDQGGNTFVDDLVGRDFWNNDNDARPAAGNSHGTHVMGIAAAETNNGVGVAGTAGGISVMPIRFYNNPSGGGWTSTVISNSYRYAASNGAKILSTSFNVDSFSTGPDAIFGAGVQFMYDAGVLHFNSQGNNPTLLNPARQRWDQSLFVVSTNSSDIKSSSSKYGWGADVAAPGDGIFSTIPANSYGNMSGTSMATPNAAGAAALIWSLHPEWTREQVASALTGTVDVIDNLPGNASFAGLMGTGRVNTNRALTSMPRAPRIKNMGATFPAQDAFVTTKPASFTLDVNNIFDPATMNLGAFELRGAGVDGQFDTPDDRLIPMTLRFGSALTTNYMIGTNRMTFTVPGAMPPDTYRFATASTLRDPFGQAVDGNGDGTGGDAFARRFTLLGATNKYTVNLADGQAVTNAHFANHDNVGPRALSSLLAFATSPHEIEVQFNEDVSDSLAQGDLTVQNLTTGTPVDMSAFTYAYDTATNTATWNVNGVLPDARFQATILATAVSDLSGNALDGNSDGTGGDDLVFDFFFLMGDANRDGNVNLDDFNVLAAHFGQTGTDFTEADFTYDGQTNLDDFNVLAAQFGKSLAGGADSTSQSSSSTRVGKTGGSSASGALGSPTRSNGSSRFGSGGTIGSTLGGRGDTDDELAPLV